MKRTLLGVMVAVLVASTGVTGMAQIAQETQASSRPLRALLYGWSIVGTWSVQVTATNCATGQELPATFPALNTFLAEGSMLSDPASNPATGRTGHGVWAHAGGLRFTNTVVLFRFNPDGTYAGTQTVRRNIVVANDVESFLTTDTVTIADPAGTVLDTRCAVGRARRLPL